MLQVWLLVVGVVALVALAIDLLWTALWVEGGQGFLTARLTSWGWRAFKRVVPRERDRVMGLAGPLMTLLTLVTWLVLLWGGWVAVFASEPRALRATHAPGFADFAGTVYFVAYSLFTMGNGDFTPQGDAWQLATALTTASGMLFVTLVITYLLSVTSAVVQKRSFANQVHGLGGTPAQILTRAWDGERFPGLDIQLQSLTTQLGIVTEQHLAYPVLHYYHADTRTKSSALAVAKLDESLTLLSEVVAPAARPAPGVVRSARSGVDTYLDTLASAFIDPAPDAPPPPPLALLREAGVPLVGDVDVAAVVARHEKRRKLLLGAVHGDGWAWGHLADRTRE